MPRVISRLTLIGVGLIGGSLARALKRAGYCGEVVGTDTRTDVLQRAMTLQVIDRGESDVTRAVQGADVVILAVPVGATESVLRQIAPHVDETTIITDVGSVKGCVIAAAKNVFGTVPANFVPGHPIAGTENSGVEASFAELFDKRRVILTPTDTTSPAALKRVREMWEQAGAECWFHKRLRRTHSLPGTGYRSDHGGINHENRVAHGGRNHPSRDGTSARPQIA